MSQVLPVQNCCLWSYIKAVFRYVCLACVLVAVCVAQFVPASSRCLAVPASAPPKERILSQQDQELIVAVRRMDLKAVNSLLEHGANVNLFDDKVLNFDSTPYPYQNYFVPTLLMEAIYFSRESPARTALIQTLLDHGADPNVTGWEYFVQASPITVALNHRQLATVYQLLEHGADPNLMIARVFPAGGIESYSIRMPVFHYFLCGVSVNFSDADRIALLAAMLAHGAQVNRRAADGYTALLWATQYGLWNAVPLLLEHHADVNAKNRAGKTALYAATNNLPTARLLLSNGAKVNVQDREGSTPLALFVSESYVTSETIEFITAMIRLFLEYGADVNIKDHYGETTLSSLRDMKEMPEVLQVIALLKEAGATELPANRHRHWRRPKASPKM